MNQTDNNRQTNQKTALITGGSRGIGAGIARLMAENGYDTVITYSTAKDEGEALAAEIERTTGRRCHLIQASLDQPCVAETTAETAIGRLGHIDVLVNNAGVTLVSQLPAMEDQLFDTLVNLNFRSYVMCARTVSRHMIKHGIRGSIINITSTRGTRAYHGDGIYGGIKAALNRATESFALDLAPYGIRVNCVAPGATQVRFSDDPERQAAYQRFGEKIPLGRVGTPRDVAQACLFLSDPDKSGYITGSVIRVDGGLILSGMPEGRNAPSWTPPPAEKTWDDSNL